MPYKELRGRSDGTPSVEIRERVEAARGLQRTRGYYNSQIPVSQLRTVCHLDEAGERTLELAVRKMNLSARAHDRILARLAHHRRFRSRRPSARPNISQKRFSTETWTETTGDNLSQEADAYCAEVADVRENRRQAAGADTEPLRQRCAVLVHGRRRIQGAPVIRVLVIAECQRRGVVPRTDECARERRQSIDVPFRGVDNVLSGEIVSVFKNNLCRFTISL